MYRFLFSFFYYLTLLCWPPQVPLPKLSTRSPEELLFVCPFFFFFYNQLPLFLLGVCLWITEKVHPVRMQLCRHFVLMCLYGNHTRQNARAHVHLCWLYMRICPFWCDLCAICITWAYSVCTYRWETAKTKASGELEMQMSCALSVTHPHLTHTCICITFSLYNRGLLFFTISSPHFLSLCVVCVSKCIVCLNVYVSLSVMDLGLCFFFVSVH